MDARHVTKAGDKHRYHAVTDEIAGPVVPGLPWPMTRMPFLEAHAQAWDLARFSTTYSILFSR